MTDNLSEAPLNESNQTRGTINHYSLGTQWLVWLLIFLSCFFLAQLISGFIILSYYKTADLKQIASNSGDLNVLRIAQMLASVFSFFVPAVIFSKLKDKKITRYPLANIGFPLMDVILIPMMIAAIYPLIDFTFFINKWMPWNSWYASFQDEYQNIVKGLLDNDNLFVFVLNFFTIAILPAICEEWIFRGTLQKLLSERMNIHIAVLLASIFFSFIHFEFSGFLPRIVLGMFLGYLFYYSGSLWTSIFAHAVNNGSQVVMMYLNNKGIYKIDIDHPQIPEIWELILYTTVFILLWYLFYHHTQKKKSSTFVG